MGMFLFIVLLIAMWQAVYWYVVELFAVFKSYSVPSPMGVGECFIRLVSDGSLLQAAGYSLLRGIAGYVAAVLIGTLLGLLMNHFTYLQKNLKPVVLGIQTLPSVCWVPFSILWFGLSTEAILFVVVMGAAFSIAISVDNAIRNVPSIYKKAALTIGAADVSLCDFSGMFAGVDFRFEARVVICLACINGRRGHDDVAWFRADADHGKRSC